MKSKSKIKFFDLPQDDPVKRKPDITKVLDNLDWKPYEKIENGLEKTILYFKQTLIDSSNK